MVSGLNFKDWEKISSDQKSTTLRHKKGHLMTIAHGVLPKIQQEQLKRLKMAEGGDVSPDQVPEPNKKAASEFSKGASDSGWQPSEWKKNLKEGLAYYADSEAPVSKEDAIDSSPEAAPSDASSIEDKGNVAPATNITINAAPPSQAAPVAAPPIAAQPLQVSPAVPAPRYEGNSEPISNVPIVPQVQPHGADQDLKQIANEGQQAISQQQAIDTAKSAENLKAVDMRLKQEQARQDQMAQSIQQARVATQRLDAYAQSHPIDKNAIFSNMSVPQKIANAIGLLAGGFDAGFSGTGNNPALNYLMDQQAKDIDAQKARWGQQNTVYEAYHKLFGDEVIASNLAAASYDQMLKHQLEATALKVGTPQAAQAAAANGAKLNLEYNEKLGYAGQRISAIRSGQLSPQPDPRSPQAKAMNQKNAPSTSENKTDQGRPDWAQGIYQPQSILSPEAKSKFNRLKNTPRLTELQKGDIADQYNKAFQADKILKDLPNLFDQLLKTASITEAAGEAAPEIAKGLGSVPIIGGGLEALGNVGAKGLGYLGASAQSMMPGQGDVIETNEQHKSLKSKLAKDISSILIKGGMDNESARKAVADNMPGVIDRNRPAAIKTKMKTIENLIKQYTQTGTLESVPGFTNAQ